VHDTASRSDSHGADSAHERAILAVSWVLPSRQTRRRGLSVLRCDRQLGERPDASARRALVTCCPLRCGGGWGGSGDHGLWRQGVDSAGFNGKRGLKQWCIERIWIAWWSAVRRPHPDRDRGLEHGLKQWCIKRSSKRGRKQWCVFARFAGAVHIIWIAVRSDVRSPPGGLPGRDRGLERERWPKRGSGRRGGRERANRFGEHFGDGPERS